MLLTFADAVESLIDYQGAQPSDTVLRDAKKAAVEALREIASAHIWSYLYKHGRIDTQCSYGCGTVTYQQSSGTYPNQLTLTGGQWPDWAPWGVVRIGDQNYDVAQLISGTVLTLRAQMAPQCDFTSVEYGLYQASYPLPEDFMSQDVTFIPYNFGNLRFVHPREWLLESAAWCVLGDPLIFTILPDRHYLNRMSMYVAPFPTYQRAIDFLYKRNLRPLSVFSYTTGTVSTAVGSNTVVGQGAAFTQNMACGCVVRVSGVPRLCPTNETGSNPAVWESKIIAVPTSQQLTTLEPCPFSLTTVPYMISSVVDIEHIMEQAYRRRCEYQICIGRKAKNKNDAYNDYKIALASAKAADYRNSYPRTAGGDKYMGRRLIDFPINTQWEG